MWKIIVFFFAWNCQNLFRMMVRKGLFGSFSPEKTHQKSLSIPPIFTLSISIAIAVLFLSPPETPRTAAFPIRVSWHLVSPSLFIKSSTRFTFSSLDTFLGSLKFAENAIFSFTVNVWSMQSSWATYPIIFLKFSRLSLLILVFWIKTSPVIWSKGSRPLKAFSTGSFEKN